MRIKAENERNNISGKRLVNTLKIPIHSIDTDIIKKGDMPPM